jgi:hypothetical protein
MYAVDDRVHRQHVEPIAFPAHHRRIIADADFEPRRPGRKGGLNTSDELALGQFEDGHLA